VDEIEIDFIVETHSGAVGVVSCSAHAVAAIREKDNVFQVIPCGEPNRYLIVFHPRWNAKYTLEDFEQFIEGLESHQKKGNWI